MAAGASFRELLGGGDRRSLGRAPTVLALLRQDPQRTVELVPLLHSPEPVVAMRASDVLEKFTRDYPAALQPFRRELMALLALAQQQELQWHLALLVPRLVLTPSQRSRAFSALKKLLTSRSSITRALALQGIADLAGAYPGLWRRTEPLLQEAIVSGTPAMKARAKLLLRKASRRK